MSNLGKTFLIAAIVSLAIGLLGYKYPIVDGLGKAMFGVFLIGYFIDLFFGERSTS